MKDAFVSYKADARLVMDDNSWERIFSSGQLMKIKSTMTGA